MVLMCRTTYAIANPRASSGPCLCAHTRCSMAVCTDVAVGHQNAPIHVHRQPPGVVEARGGALPVGKAGLPVAGQRAHRAATSLH